MTVRPLIHEGNVQGIKKILTWTAPAIAIPGLRYTQDSHSQRKELFIRDASTYSIGAATFLSTEYVVKKGLNRFNIIQDSGQRKLAAFLVGLTANLLYAGIGAVRFSKWFSRYQAQKVTENQQNQRGHQPEFSPFPTNAGNVLPQPTRSATPMFENRNGMQYLA